MSTNFGSFKWLTGDVCFTDHGGKWYRRFGKRQERVYHVIELDNWHEHEREPEFTYHCSLSEVDLSAMPPDAVLGALRSCGLEMDGRGSIIGDQGDEIARRRDSVFDLILVDCLHGYGNKAPLWQESGNNWRKLMRAARAESSSLRDPSEHARALERVVNRIGTSARDYMLGRLFTNTNND